MSEEETKQGQATIEEFIQTLQIHNPPFSPLLKVFLSSHHQFINILMKEGTPEYLELVPKLHHLLHQIPSTTFLEVLSIATLKEISNVHRLLFISDLEQCGLSTETTGFDFITFFHRIDFFDGVDKEKKLFVKSTYEILYLRRTFMLAIFNSIRQDEKRSQLPLTDPLQHYEEIQSTMATDAQYRVFARDHNRYLPLVVHHTFFFSLRPEDVMDKRTGISSMKIR